MAHSRRKDSESKMQLPPQWRWKLDRWKEQLASVFSAKKGEEARPKLCPACGILVGASARKCHECGTSMSFSMAAVSKSLGEAIPQETPVTYFLLASNFMLFLVCLGATWQHGSPSLFSGIRSDILLRLGARSTDLILRGEVWRLVMPIFLHGGLMHIGMNMFVLKDLGPQLEEVYGSARYLFLYVITGVIGFAWTTTWDCLYLARHVSPSSEMFRQYLQMFPISIGASGSLMGLLGLAIAITTVRGGAYMQMIRSQLLRSFGIILVVGLIIPGIDNAAHIGGFASGFLLGRVFSPTEPARGVERRRAYALGWVGGLMVAGSFVATVIRFFASS